MTGVAPVYDLDIAILIENPFGRLSFGGGGDFRIRKPIIEVEDCSDYSVPTGFVGLEKLLSSRDRRSCKRE
jgi:hypothetical protein